MCPAHLIFTFAMFSVYEDYRVQSKVSVAPPSMFTPLCSHSSCLNTYSRSVVNSFNDGLSPYLTFCLIFRTIAVGLYTLEKLLELEVTPLRQRFFESLKIPGLKANCTELFIL